MAIYERIVRTMTERELAGPDDPVVLMVSGGSDSTALAYLAARMKEEGLLGPIAMLHVNHQLRGEGSDHDELFVRRLAGFLGIPLTCAAVDVHGACEVEGGNVEAVARRLRYNAAHEALAALCQEEAIPVADGRLMVAHTADDRVENFYMRSIVGTGPGGFRSMRYRNGQVVRPLLDASRQELCDFLRHLAAEGEALATGAGDALWCEDPTNAQTDRFRAFVRHEIVPLAKERNPELLSTLTRTMNNIADEDDYMTERTEGLLATMVEWIEPALDGCILAPALAREHVALQRRVVVAVLGRFLGPDVRIERGTIDSILQGFVDGAPNSGYVANIQGNLAVSANKAGVRIEPMAAFRIRRNRA